MATAFELSRTPEARVAFDVTVYQMGWRLGGKCAAGRGEHQRIEEHGLHLLGGSYENAFTMLREAYGEVGQDWQEHFQGRDNVVMEEKPADSPWLHWPYAFHDKPGSPGDGENTIPESVEAVIERMVGWMNNHVQSLGDEHPLGKTLSTTPPAHETPPVATQIESSSEPPHHSFLSTAWSDLKSFVGAVTGHKPEIHHVTTNLRDFASYGWEALEKFVESEAIKAGHDVEEIVKFNEALIKGDTTILSDFTLQIRRDYILLVTVAAHAIGLLSDIEAIRERGLDALDDIEYKDWIRTHDPSPSKVAADGAPVNTLYELVFAYRNGSLSTPAFSAGVGVRSLWRLCFNYKGAIWYQMQGSTGDIIFGPLYETLKRRGVHFKFFHRIQELHLDAEGKNIASIEVAEQVRLKEGREEYEPVHKFKELWTWPNQPFYDQLELTDAEERELRELQEEFNGLESPWSPWRTRERMVSLRAGEDFDEAVLAISVAALPAICGELIAALPQWQKLVNTVETVETVCVQLWMNRSLEELGWDNSTMGEHPFIADYAKPLSSAGDYSTLAVKEDWPDGKAPKTIWYFCSSWSAGETPSPDDDSFPMRARARFKEQSLDWLNQYLEHLFPNVVSNGELDWDLFIDERNRQGAARFDAQYWRTNVNPSDHYVLSVPGSSSARLRADESGVGNLVLAGDWTYNGFNLGCVEAGVMSGKLAARVLFQGARLPFDRTIVGEKDFPWL